MADLRKVRRPTLLSASESATKSTLQTALVNVYKKREDDIVESLNLTGEASAQDELKHLLEQTAIKYAEELKDKIPVFLNERKGFLDQLPNSENFEKEVCRHAAQLRSELLPEGLCRRLRSEVQTEWTKQCRPLVDGNWKQSLKTCFLPAVEPLHWSAGQKVVIIVRTKY